MSKPAYRPATLNDIPIIVDFQIAMALETEGISLNREVCAAGVRQVFERSALGRYYVGEKDGRVVAALMITYEWSDWRNGIVWWIQSVFVVPEARRQGMYAGLYGYIRTLVESDPDVCGLRLYVDRRNTAAQQVYARLGMDGGHYQVFEWMKNVRSL
jgi:predicted GNAT family acetyltransferase